MTELTKDPRIAFPNAKDRIVFAFELEGTPYFQFHDINEVPCDRGFNALLFYRELSMKCTTDFLDLHTQAIENIINNNAGIKVTEIAKLNMQLRERIKWILEPEIAYKLCSVVFFDATENPYRYNFKHSINKAMKFMTEDMEDFFLSQPIVNLIPHINSLTSGLREYCLMVNAMTKEHLESISTMLSEVQQNSEPLKLLKLLNQKVSTSQQ